MRRRLRLLGSMLLACSMCLSSPAIALAEEIPATAAETSEDTKTLEDADTQLTAEDASIPKDEIVQESPSEETAAPEDTEKAEIPETAALLEEADAADAEPAEADDNLAACPAPLAVEPTEGQTAGGNTEQLYAAPSFCSSEEWEMLKLVNKKRLEQKLQPLSVFNDLQKSCDTRAVELVQKFDHTRPNGSSCFTALEGSATTYSKAGENIAAGNQKPADTFQQWMNSPRHKENMLDPAYSHMGVGYHNDPATTYKHYWVQMFLGGCTPTEINVQNTSEKTIIPGNYGATIDSMDLILEVKCDHGTSYLPLMKEMCSGYDATKVGDVQKVTVNYNGKSTFFYINIATSVTYRTHVQTYGWQKWTSNGEENGTTGQSKRLEGIDIKLEGESVKGDIEYSTHVQTYGWRGWSKNGETSGTTGESKRLEAIKIRLTGEMADKYDIYYQVHAQTFGWLDWAKNGEPAGTEGYAKRLESIRIQLVEKGKDAPGETDVPFKAASLQYQTHVQTYGWQNWVKDEEVSGTTGQSKRLEAINIKLIDNPDHLGGIRYCTHVQTFGWQDWRENGVTSGTSGQSKRLEAIRIELTGDMANKYDVYYQVHAQTYGWMGWAKNGEPAGTAGYAKRLEGIRIQLVPKGGKAPGKTDNAYVEKEKTI